jgi:hypothetical protein
MAIKPTRSTLPITNSSAASVLRIMSSLDADGEVSAASDIGSVRNANVAYSLNVGDMEMISGACGVRLALTMG